MFRLLCSFKLSFLFSFNKLPCVEFFPIFPPGKLFIFYGLLLGNKNQFWKASDTFYSPIMKARKLKAPRNNPSVLQWCRMQPQYSCVNVLYIAASGCWQKPGNRWWKVGLFLRKASRWAGWVSSRTHWKAFSDHLLCNSQLWENLQASGLSCVQLGHLLIHIARK